MTIHIDFIDETGEVTAEQLEMLEQLLREAAASENVPDGTEVGVSFVDNERIRLMNRDYRGKDAPTDVLSFALEEEGEGEVDIIGADMPLVLGDIVISIPKAKEQAAEYGHSFMRELGFWPCTVFCICLAMTTKRKRKSASCLPSKRKY